MDGHGSCPNGNTSMENRKEKKKDAGEATGRAREELSQFLMLSGGDGMRDGVMIDKVGVDRQG